MKKILLSSFFFTTCILGFSQTMTFDNGASEPGFTLNGWNAAGGTIWMENLANPATISKDDGTWDFISFEVGPFIGANDMQVSSDLGQTYDYNTNVAGFHLLDWTGVTTVTFTRISGSGAAADHDNFKYSISLPCIAPEVPVLSYTPSAICDGDPVSLGISGNLNDATAWHIYSDSCNGISIGTSSTSNFMMIPPNTNTTYFVRGEDGSGCVDESMGTCAEITIPVFSVEVGTSTSGATIQANAMEASYQWIDCDNGNTPILEETNAFFTALENGNYAVVVTQNNCTDTSTCVNIMFSGIHSVPSPNIKVYPNPTTGILHLELDQIYKKTEVRVNNVIGELISKHLYDSTDHIKLEIEGMSGLYSIEILTNEERRIPLLISLNK